MLPGNTTLRLAPYLRWLRLEQRDDLPLLIWPLLWASFLAAGGAPAPGGLLLLLLAALALRCAAWLYNDVLEARLLRIAPESYVALGELPARHAWQLIAGLLLLAGLTLLLLPTVVWYFAPVALLAPALFPWLKRRSYLVQMLLAFGTAWTVPVAYAAQGVLPDKGGWLLFVAALCWGAAGQLLLAVPRAEREAKVGIRSLAQLFGPLSLFWVGGLQLAALVALLLLGRQEMLGIFHALGLLTALALSCRQLWLLYPEARDAEAHYDLHHWWALAVFCALLFPSLCACGAAAVI